MRGSCGIQYQFHHHNVLPFLSHRNPEIASVALQRSAGKRHEQSDEESQGSDEGQFVKNVRTPGVVSRTEEQQRRQGNEEGTRSTRTGSVARNDACEVIIPVAAWPIACVTL